MNHYPVRVEGRLDTPLSRWLWLVKWLLAIPHYIVLSLLWPAFFLLTVVAFVAIPFTGRYPRAIFDFNVGVLRWTWRVVYYSYGALGTDRYPPFTLRPDPGYPAAFDVDYPERLSRGLVLVKSWLLAIPHYLLVAVFISGALLIGDRYEGAWQFNLGGLISVLVLIAALTLLFTGRYPRGIFDIVLGMNRWTLRVAAYAALMTDAYPPFRLDAGEREPAAGDDPPVESPHAPAHRWTSGAILAVLSGSVLALVAAGTAFAGIGAATLHFHRDSDGFIAVDAGPVTTTTYAITTGDVRLTTPGARFLRDYVGRIRIEAHSTGTPVFIGVAPTAAVDRYLGNVAHDQLRQLGQSSQHLRHGGSQPAAPPLGQHFWAAQSDGSTLSWETEPGEWTLVLMNADATPGVTADLRLAAAVPALGGLTAGLLATSALFALTGAGLILLGLHLAAPPRTQTRQPATTGS
ncbi:hypothetical protein GCM10009555_038620 [Acrocarpospora macrocephala]|uniref:DUF4389 domain-containing protein n=1 Tax=Acrocarpospora macrocephala TaxID=150177 RepID=A0A5M3WUD7_9ACTN|nr:DUF4389 domain-containing protein [Acrocarpospora macrocephala]GES09748.1 hypothetical protein Amac_033440 [Acrocarpospora macrocephala]